MGCVADILRQDLQESDLLWNIRPITLDAHLGWTRTRRTRRWFTNAPTVGTGLEASVGEVGGGCEGSISEFEGQAQVLG